MKQLFDNEDILLDEIQQKEVLPNIPKTRARSIWKHSNILLSWQKIPVWMQISLKMHRSI